MNESLIVRPAKPCDIDAVVSLQRACFPPPFPAELLWQAKHLDSHLKHFAEGQFIAEVDGQIVASATNILVTDEDWEAHLTWQSVTGGLHLDKHDAEGKTLYGIDISVHPDFRGRGIARRLYQARFDLVATRKLTRYGTVCRIPDFDDSPFQDPLQYVQAVLNHQIEDRTLTPLVKIGLQFQGLIPDYLDDPESGNFGAILERV